MYGSDLNYKTKLCKYN